MAFGVVRGLLGELDVEVVLKGVLEAARELTGAGYAALGVLARQEHDDGEGIGLTRFIAVGVDERTRLEIGSLPRGLGVLGEPIRDPVPLRLADISLTRAPMVSRRGIRRCERSLAYRCSLATVSSGTYI
jgi:hypothetical protein